MEMRDQEEKLGGDKMLGIRRGLILRVSDRL